MRRWSTGSGSSLLELVGGWRGRGHVTASRAGRQSGHSGAARRAPASVYLLELQIEVSVSQTSPEGLRSPLAASHQQVTMETNGGSSGERSEDGCVYCQLRTWHSQLTVNKNG